MGVYRQRGGVVGGVFYRLGGGRTAAGIERADKRFSYRGNETRRDRTRSRMLEGLVKCEKAEVEECNNVA